MKKGFTLIELLVVIAIIAILAAILFPVFAKAREKARQSSCLSNVKQIMLGVLQYAQDYDEVLPYASTWGEPSPRSWWQYLDPYVKNVQIFKCPSQNGASCDYGWNYQNFGYRAAANDYRYGAGTSLGAVQQPADTIVIGDDPDTATAMYGAGNIYIYGPTQVSPPADGIGNVSGRHNDGGNYAFCDGHAKWMSRSQVAGQDRLWTLAAD